MAGRTIEKFLARAVRLYEQEQGGAFRLPLAWVICPAVAEVGEIYHLFVHCRCRTYSHLLLDTEEAEVELSGYYAYCALLDGIVICVHKYIRPIIAAHKKL